MRPAHDIEPQSKPAENERKRVDRTQSQLLVRGGDGIRQFPDARVVNRGPSLGLAFRLVHGPTCERAKRPGVHLLERGRGSLCHLLCQSSIKSEWRERALQLSILRDSEKLPRTGRARESNQTSIVVVVIVGVLLVRHIAARELALILQRVDGHRATGETANDCSHNRFTRRATFDRLDR